MFRATYMTTHGEMFLGVFDDCASLEKALRNAAKQTRVLRVDAQKMVLDGKHYTGIVRHDGRKIIVEWENGRPKV